MTIVAWIVLGLIAGFIGSKVVNSTGAGIVGNLVVGVVGAYAGGFLFNTFGARGITGFNLWSLVVASFGAIVLLSVFNAIAGPRRGRLH